MTHRFSPNVRVFPRVRFRARLHNVAKHIPKSARLTLVTLLSPPYIKFIYILCFTLYIKYIDMSMYFFKFIELLCIISIFLILYKW